MGNDLFSDLCRAACCPDGCLAQRAEGCLGTLYYKPSILAILRRLRVPDEAMVNRGADPLLIANDREYSRETYQDDAAAVWAAMLDHLIAEGERRG